MDILLTFTGFHDPYFRGLVGQEEQAGPILSLLSARPFNQIYLFSTPSSEQITVKTKEVINSIYPGTDVQIAYPELGRSDRLPVNPKRTSATCT